MAAPGDEGLAPDAVTRNRTARRVTGGHGSGVPPAVPRLDKPLAPH